jgi:hypothetical protein
MAGRPLHYAFRGLLSVYSRYGLPAHRVAYATFYTEGFSSFVASAAASIVTGWSEPVPGRDFSPAEDQRLFTAHTGKRVNQALTLSRGIQDDLLRQKTSCYEFDAMVQQVNAHVWHLRSALCNIVVLTPSVTFESF